MKTNSKEIFKALKNEFFDGVSYSKGDVIVRQGYFYRHDRTSTKLNAKVTEILVFSGIDFKAIKDGDHYASFRGGASLANSSHFWVRVTPVEVADEVKA